MSVVKQKDRRSGITYVYNSYNYWDKELKKHRAKRTLLGRLDEATGKVIPTDGRCKKRSPSYQEPAQEKVKELQQENDQLRLQVETLKEQLKKPKAESVEESGQLLLPF